MLAPQKPRALGLSQVIVPSSLRIWRDSSDSLASSFPGGRLHISNNYPLLAIFPVLKMFCHLVSGAVHPSNTGMKRSSDAGGGRVPWGRLEQ